MTRLAGNSSSYTIGILNSKGKPTEHTWQFPSVTHILDVVAKPALYRWYFTEGISGISEILQKYGDKTPTDVKSLMSLMSKHKLGPYAVRDAKADLGKKIHADLENLCQGKPVVTTPLNSGIFAWYDQGITSSSAVVVATEQPLVSFSYQVAGTTDIIYRTKDGETILGDLKTGSTVPTTAYIQIEAYKMMWEEMGGEPIARTEIIHCPVNKPGTFKVLRKPSITKDHFLRVLELYRALEGEKL